jgi:glutamate synthase (NADPH/NADH) large chain
VVGPTGRNFAAGMSGGIAYVLDEEGDFERRCNLAMVDLEPISSENQVMERSRHQIGDLESHGLVDFTDMTRFDEERLYQLIESHLHYTGSARAKAILDDWASYLPKFVKVMPVEYRRALEEMARRQSVDKPGLGEIEIGLRGNSK